MAMTRMPVLKRMASWILLGENLVSSSDDMWWRKEGGGGMYYRWKERKEAHRVGRGKIIKERSVMMLKVAMVRRLPIARRQWSILTLVSVRSMVCLVKWDTHACIQDQAPTTYSTGQHYFKSRILSTHKDVGLHSPIVGMRMTKNVATMNQPRTLATNWLRCDTAITFV